MIDLGWYRKLLVIFAVGGFYTSFCDYSERFGLNALFWIILMAALASPLLLQALFESSYRLQPLLIWGCGYLLISIIWYFPAMQYPWEYRQLRLRILSVIFLFLMLFLMSRPEEQRLARICVAFGVLFGTALNIYEQFHPLTFSTVPGRSSGLYPNINQSGAALMLGMILSQPALPKKLRIPFSLIAAVGIVTTFSRAAILGWILVMGFWAIRSGLNASQISRTLVTLALLFGFFTSSYWQGVQTKLEERGALNADVMQRLQFFSQGDTTDPSANERESVAAYAWRLFEQKPLLGWGTGASDNLDNSDVGTHNIYLALMIDHGFLGMFIVPLLLLATVWGCRREVFDVAAPFVLFVTMWGFFSHNVLEERYILLTVALLGSMVMQERLATKPRRAAAASRVAPNALGAAA